MSTKRKTIAEWQQYVDTKFGCSRLKITGQPDGHRLNASCLSCGIDKIVTTSNLQKARSPCVCIVRESSRLENTCPENLQQFVRYCYDELMMTQTQICQLADLRSSTVRSLIERSDVRRPHNELNGLVRARENSRVASIVTAPVYKSAAYVVTNHVYRRYKHILDPKGKRGPDFHLDHMLSIIDGFRRFKAPLSLDVLCHPANLKIKTRKSNASKQHRSTLTLAKLKQSIKTFESKHGPVIFPDHLQLDFASGSEITTGVNKGLNVLSFDPGTRNFGVFGGTLFGAKTLHKIRPKLSTMLENPIRSFGPELWEDTKLFREEIRQLVLTVRPDVIVIERYQSRGLKGTTIEMVNFMIGYIYGMLDVLSEELGKPVVIKLLMASTWKNALNRKFRIEELYEKMPESQWHRLDACLMGISVFPDKDVYASFDNRRKAAIVDFILRTRK